MYFRAPRSLPPLSVLLDALPGSAKAWAMYLGVSTRTFARWQALDMAPRPYQLALYWESYFGIAHLEVDAHNAACQSAAMSACLQRDLDRARAQIARLEADHDWGSANSPVFNVN